MFRMHIRSKRESQQHRGYHNEYECEPDDEVYGYSAHNDYEQQDGHEPERRPGTCCICGDTITNGHLVFSINKDKEYELHTSCLITGMALITNGIMMLVGLLKQKFGGKNQEQLESEEK